MLVDLVDRTEAVLFGVDAALDQVPGPGGEEVIWIFELGLLENFVPVAEVLPCFVNSGACERWVAGEGFEEHAAEGPVVYCEVVLLAFENFGSHVVWGADYGLCVVDFAFAEGSVAISSFGDRTLFHWVAEGG